MRTGQIGRGDEAPYARPVVSPVAIGGCAGAHRVIAKPGARRDQGGKEKNGAATHIGACFNGMSPRVLFDYLENSVDPLTPGGPDESQEDSRSA
jgi:hypothetical protein